MLAPVTRAARFRAGPIGRLPGAGARFAAAAWRRWFLDRQADFWLGELHAGWSLTELRARVLEVIDETHDTRTFVLAPGRRWPGHRAGQYVPIEVELDGVRIRRCYTISSGGSPPGARRIAITVRRSGRVSSWMHASLQVGDVIGLGQPAGEFVVPAPAPPLLLVGAGSGITPVMAILRDLPPRTDVVVVHAARGEADAIFGRALAELAALRPALRLVTPRGPRLEATALRAAVPDLAGRATYVCGPPGLIDLVLALAPGARHERFASPPPAQLAEAGADPVRVTLGRRTVVAAGPGSLLDQLERAGERPAHGCRMGICNTCRCRKRTGTVEDLATGAVSSEPDQDIRLCTSIARSDLELVEGAP